MSETKDVLILAIESSCDETAAAVVKNGREVMSNVISSQIALHTLYGGVVPEIASRKHIEKINQVIEEALKEADYTAGSWKVLQVALKNAKSALEAKKDQTSVDNAAASLNKAMEALVKAGGTTPTPTPTTTPTATPAASKNTTPTSGTGNKTITSSGSTSSSKTAKTGDPTNIFEMLGLAVASLGTGGFALKRRKRNKK